jgi:hypothetical protein
MSENESSQNLQNIFRGRAKRNMHIIITTGSSKQAFYRDAPELSTSCSLNYYDQLPSGSLEDISRMFFAGIENGVWFVEPATFKHKTVLDCVERLWNREDKSLLITHSFLQLFMNTFVSLHKKRIETSGAKKKRIEENVEKLHYIMNVLKQSDTPLSEFEPTLQPTLEPKLE